MEHIGIDVHKNESQICRLTEQGEIVELRIATRPDRFAAVLGGLPRARILIEASTESEWVARCLERLATRDRRRPQLRADVRQQGPPRKDRPA
jgi:hypothetical protein